MNQSRVRTLATIAVHDIKRSAARGAVFVTVRQLVVQGANIVGTILLTRKLSTTEFGLYAILLYLSQALSLLSGAALALQVVRSPVPLSKHALRVLFTAQLGLSLFSSITLWTLGPVAAHGFHGGAEAVYAIRIVSVGALLSCFQTIPIALLERGLGFARLAAVEIVQALTFNAIAVGTAWAGYGVRGVAIGILIRVLVGALTVNALQRWPFGLAVDFSVLRQEIGSGISYFGAAVISMIKDAVNPVFVGLLLGAAGAGLVSWANTLASYCLIALMMMQRLYIPTFSRMAEHPEDLGPFVTSVLKLTNAAAAPAACLLLVLIHPITLNVFGEKWRQALPAFYLFWAGNLIVPTITPLVSLLQAVNRGDFVFYASLMWMVLTWVLGVPAILAYGVVGAGLANCIVQCSNYFVIRFARREVRFEILRHVLPYWGIAGTTSAVIWWIEELWPAATAVRTFGYLAGGGVTYFALVLMCRRDDVRAVLRLVRSGMGRGANR